MCVIVGERKRMMGVKLRVTEICFFARDMYTIISVISNIINPFKIDILHDHQKTRIGVAKNPHFYDYN